MGIARATQLRGVDLLRLCWEVGDLDIANRACHHLGMAATSGGSRSGHVAHFECARAMPTVDLRPIGGQRNATHYDSSDIPTPPDRRLDKDTSAWAVIVGAKVGDREEITAHLKLALLGHAQEATRSQTR